MIVKHSFLKGHWGREVNNTDVTCTGFTSRGSGFTHQENPHGGVGMSWLRRMAMLIEWYMVYLYLWATVHERGDEEGFALSFLVSSRNTPISTHSLRQQCHLSQWKFCVFDIVTLWYKSWSPGSKAFNCRRKGYTRSVIAFLEFSEISLRL